MFILKDKFMSLSVKNRLAMRHKSLIKKDSVAMSCLVNKVRRRLNKSAADRITTKMAAEEMEPTSF